VDTVYIASTSTTLLPLDLNVVLCYLLLALTPMPCIMGYVYFSIV